MILPDIPEDIPEVIAVFSAFDAGIPDQPETGNADALVKTARALLSAEFSPALRAALESGCSFPTARQQASQPSPWHSSIGPLTIRSM